MQLVIISLTAPPLVPPVGHSDLAPPICPGPGAPGLEIGQNSRNVIVGVKLFNPGIQLLEFPKTVGVVPGPRPIIPEPGKLWRGKQGGNRELVQLVHIMIPVVGENIILETKDAIHKGSLALNGVFRRRKLPISGVFRRRNTPIRGLETFGHILAPEYSNQGLETFGHI